MLTPSRKMRFAIEAVLDIAYNAGPVPVRSRDITLRQGIPRRYLEPTLQHLVKSGILQGVRGPRGGYRLGRERRRISLGEIVRVIEGLEAGEREEDEDEDGNSELGRQVIAPIWDELRAGLMARLDEITVDELCLRAYRSGVASKLSQAMDFTI